MIEDVVARHVVGREPFHIEATWRDVYASGYALRPDPTLVGVLSGIEMAMWDIVGKAVGKPVYELLGGRVRERLRSYSYLYARAGRRDRRLPRSRSGRRARGGVRRARLHRAQVRSGRRRTRRSIRASRRSPISIAASATSAQIREAVGSRCDLLFGTHGQFTVAGAIRLARRLERFEPLWFEEPTPPEAPEEMARVARATSIPIATGERLTTKYEFARVLETGAAAILQMNLGRVGGLLEAQEDRRAWPSATTRRSRRTSTAGPSSAPPTSSSRRARRTSSILEGIGRWDGIHADAAEGADPLGGRLRDPADRARPRRRARRGRRARASLQRAAPAPRGRLGRAPRRRGRDVNVGFIGLGNLGRHLAARLLAGRLPADRARPRRRRPSRRLVAAGATRGADSPRAVAEASDCVITCLPSPQAVERVVAGPAACSTGLRRGGTWIDMSTNDPHELERLAALARGARRRDARVPGHGRRPQGRGRRDHRHRRR